MEKPEAADERHSCRRPEKDSGLWRYLLNTVNEPVTLAYVCKLNEFIARNEALVWGKLRTGTVGISGTDYMPPVPSEERAECELKEILSKDTSETEKALNAFIF